MADEPAERQNGQQLLKAFREDLSNLRHASIGSAFIHYLATTFLLIIGFTKGLDEAHRYSVTTMTCAFGGVVTCGLASWRTYRTWHDTMAEEMPSYSWYNMGYVWAAFNAFLLGLALWPAIVVFIFHSKGTNMWTLIFSTKVPGLEGTIIFHIVVFIMVGVLDLYLMAKVTQVILRFTNDEEGETETQAEEDEEDEENEDSDEKLYTVEKADQIVAAIAFVLNIIYLVDLSMIADYKANSGTAMCVAAQAVVVLFTLYFTFRFISARSVTESYLGNFRAGVILHGFVVFCLFWVSLAVLLMVVEYKSSGFFGTVSGLPGARGPIIFIVLSVFVCMIVDYAYILRSHNLAMWKVDQIASEIMIDNVMEGEFA